MNFITYIAIINAIIQYMNYELSHYLLICGHDIIEDITHYRY
jgi:hypothetical protein